jgi:hypothetical protein
VKVAATVHAEVDPDVQLPVPASVKSRLGAPCVTTSMLPTVVPPAMLNESETVLGEPMFTEPKFSLAVVPVYVTCAWDVAGNNRASKTGKAERRRQADARVFWTLRRNGMAETSRGFWDGVQSLARNVTCRFTQA